MSRILKTKVVIMRMVWLLVGAFSMSFATAQERSFKLKVLSYNIHVGNPPGKPGVTDLKGIAKVINDSDADLVALQEVDVFTNRSGKNLDQATELARLTN